MPDSLDSTFDAFLKALLNVSQRVSFGTKDQGVQIKASPVLKLCPGIGQDDTRGARKGSAAGQSRMSVPKAYAAFRRRNRSVSLLIALGCAGRIATRTGVEPRRPQPYE